MNRVQIFSVCFVFCLLPKMHADDAEMLAKYAKEWNKYIQVSQNLMGQVTMLTKMTSPKGQTWTEKRVRKLSRNGKFNLLTLEYSNTRENGGASETIVIANNDRYAFLLDQSKDKSSWVVSGMDRKTTDGSTLGEQNGTPLHEDLDVWSNYPISVGGTAMTKWMEKPAFRVTKITERPDGFVQLSFSCPSDWKKKGWNPIQEADVVLDPKSFYCVISFNAKTSASNGPGETIVKNNYRSLAPLPLLESSVETSSRNGKVFREEQILFELEERSPPDKSAFTLSAFGLPEPFEVGKSKQSTLWMWGAGAGIILLLTGILLRRWVTKQPQFG